MASSSSSGGGISIFGTVGIVFVVLKLVGVISWSWWWVLLPFWGGAIITISLLVVLLLVAFRK